MISQRLYIGGVLLAWGVTMGWLVWSRVVPPIRHGQPPTFQDVLPREAEVRPVEWQILLNGNQIGFATNQVIRRDDGTGELASRVELQDLPVAKLVQQTLGWMAAALPALSGGDLDEIGEIDMSIRTEMSFSHFGELTSFTTSVGMEGFQDVIKLYGAVHDDQLQVKVRSKLLSDSLQEDSDGGGYRQLYETVVQIPPGQLVADSLSPQPRLGRLKVGQSWSFQSYRPLSITGGMDTIWATVDEKTTVDWQGQDRPVHIVRFRRNYQRALSAEEEPIGQLWVDEDGEVLQQQMQVGGLQVLFVRTEGKAVLMP
ncbi:MAG: hypothetical protein R3C28_16380 [Pirellulaceae bacterium]